jgi:glycosyltransferase involved in cell wall biosynthesis
MSSAWPAKVLLTGGAPGGGVDSFARALECGFKSLGIAAEVIEPLRIYARPGELRDLRVLKILSTSAAFAVPYARRAIVMAHGFPCARNQGWARTLAVLASFKLANWTHRAQLIAVSSYSALHLETIFNIRIDGIIKNPLHPVFANRPPANSGRHAIAYVGRLHRSKNVLQAVSAMRGVIQRHDGLEAWVIGGGPEYDSLAKIHKEEKRIKFWGILPREEVR